MNTAAVFYIGIEYLSKTRERDLRSTNFKQDLPIPCHLLMISTVSCECSSN